MLKELLEGLKNNPLWFGAIGAVTVVQGWLGWRFWGALTDEPGEQAALRAVGMAFVVGEVVALDMASRAALRSEPVRAHTLRAMWLSLAILNLGVDVNALTRVLETHDDDRETAKAAYAATIDKRARLERDIATADDAYDDELLPVAAYDAQIASKAREMDLAASAPAWRQRRLERERGELEARRAVAQTVAAWKVELERMGAPEAAKAAPRDDAAEFEPLARALTATASGTDRVFGGDGHTQVTSQDVRTGVAIAASIAIKIMLTFGVWAGLERGAPAVSAQAPERPAPQQIPPTPSPEATRGAVTPFPAGKRAGGVQRFGRGGRRP